MLQQAAYKSVMYTFCCRRIAKSLDESRIFYKKSFQKLSVEDRDGNGVWDDEWYGVLCGARYVETPGVLLEHSFHTNYRSTVWLYNDSNLQKMAKAEAEVIFEYFTQKKAEESVDAVTSSVTTPDEAATTETTTTTVRVDPVPSEDTAAGDVNGDGNIDLSDAVLVIEYYAQKASGIETSFIRLDDDPEGELLVFKAADIIADDMINLDDATEILSIYAETAAGIITDKTEQ